MDTINSESLACPGAGSSRRSVMRLFAGASFALAYATIAGCANMKAGPKPKHGDSYITGRGGGPGGGMR